MPQFLNSEMSQLAAVIQRDILLAHPNVKWDDIIELHEAKLLLKEAVVMPIKYPQFFTGLLAPWKGVLLYGPPGTGKTMLAKAVATECKTTFFNISASSLVAKYRGESEKLCRLLFDLARHHAPSTIFIDEIDSIMGSRDSGTEHEASRRLKTELMIQMDGLAKSDALVFVLAASNTPWSLDTAILRRLEKRIFISLPGPNARQGMMQHYLTSERCEAIDFERLALKTEGYSGADIVLLCKEAAMRPVRKLMSLLATLDTDDNRHADTTVELELVTSKDIRAALSCVKPSASSKHCARYQVQSDEL